MNDRPTPETDAEIGVGYMVDGRARYVDLVHPDFARQLERERDEAREKLSAGRALADRLADSLTACERWVNQPCAVKTEANKALMEWKEARK